MLGIEIVRRDIVLYYSASVRYYVACDFVTSCAEKRASSKQPVAMPLVIEVSLISGKTVLLQADVDESVDSLKQRAQIALGVGRGQLLAHCGILDGRAKLKETRRAFSQTPVCLFGDSIQVRRDPRHRIRGTRFPGCAAETC